MKIRRRNTLPLPADIRQVLKRLSHYRGQFEICDEGTVRHKTMCTPVFPTISACPLAFLCIEEGLAYVSNNSVNDFSTCLGISIDSAVDFMRAADHDKEVPGHSRRLVHAIRKALVRACVRRKP
jgi:hypothetical protein